MALLPGSPAIGAGNAALLPAGTTTDQRGVPRVINGRLDIGAYESRAFTVTITSGNNQETPVDTAFPAPLVVTVSSPDGDPVAGGMVTFAAGTNPYFAACTFPGGASTATATINAAGQASITATANSVTGSYGVSAGAVGTPLTGFLLTNTAGPPTQLVIHTEPLTGTAGQVFAPQPVIYLEDASGNLDTSDNTTQVSVSVLGDDGPLHGTLTVTASGGIATFTNVAENTAGPIQLFFTSVGFNLATSRGIFISPAQPSQLVILRQPSPTATTGQAFATQPVIYEEDQYGNLETGDNSTKVTASLRVGTGPLLGSTTVTVAGGIATFTNLADDTAETIILVFTAPGLDKTTSNPIIVSSGGNNGSISGGVAKVKIKHAAGYEGMKRREATIKPQGTDRLTEAHERLVRLYEATNKPDKAARWRKERESQQRAERRAGENP